MEKCGGGRAQSSVLTDTPRAALVNQLAVQANSYKEVALENGIAFR